MTDTLSTPPELHDWTSMLPSELLAHIFVHLIALHPRNRVQYHQHGWSRPVHRTSWVYSATHVCRRWRSTALNSPIVWSRLFLDMHSAWEIFVQRSESALLRVEGLCYSGLAVARFPFLHEQRHRIRELNLSDLTSTHLPSLIPILVNPFPQLEVLSLQGRWAPGEAHLMRLPDKLLPDILPDLRRLDLAGIDFVYGASSLSLKELYIRNSEVLPGLWHATDVPAMLAALSQMPALRILHLGLSPPLEPQSEGDDINASLSYLQELDLSGDAPTCRQIRAHLALPATARCTDHASELEALVSTFQAHLSV
ncbi:hypothetical protein PENSPDRAFT_756060 [Peniophora sp. CONT]|nr:hypothetical protein PENSPDRAFT_756060 [Peniophora sp. CONT]